MISNLPDIDLNLRGKIALVTGGSNETGIAICHALASAGASVIIHYNKNREFAEQACRDVISRGGEAVTYGADFSGKTFTKDEKNPPPLFKGESGGVDSLFSFIKERFGRLNILINNAHLPLKRTFLKDITWEEHQEQIDVMVKGTFYCSKKAVEIMSEPLIKGGLSKGNKNPPPLFKGGLGWVFSGEQRIGGSIINILTSQTEHPVSGYSSYVTAASALTGFTRSLAAEAGCMGIRVNMIAPNFILTTHTPNAPQHVHESIIKSTPLGRLATPDDIAKAVLFFASDMSEFITGCYLVIDGGYSISGIH